MTASTRFRVRFRPEQILLLRCIESLSIENIDDKKYSKRISPDFSGAYRADKESIRAQYKLIETSFEGQTIITRRCRRIRGPAL